MKTSSVAREYAKALFLLGQRTDRLDEIGDELYQVNSLVQGNEPIRDFLLAPPISTEEKQKVIGGALKGKVSEQLYRFIMVLIEKRRQDYLDEICTAYREELNRHYNRVEVEVESAVELTGKEHENLVAMLSSHLGRNVVAKSAVNTGLLGGLVCRIGDVVYDGSLRRRMQRLSDRMLKAKV